MGGSSASNYAYYMLPKAPSMTSATYRASHNHQQTFTMFHTWMQSGKCVGKDEQAQA